MRNRDTYFGVVVVWAGVMAAQVFGATFQGIGVPGSGSFDIRGISSNRVVVGAGSGGAAGWMWDKGVFTTFSDYGYFSDISDNGSTIIANIGGPGGYFYIITHGQSQAVPLYPGSPSTYAWNISKNASIIVGDTRESQPWIYREGGYESLALPDGYTGGSATAVSSDGSVIAGRASSSSLPMVAVRWINGELEVIPSPANTVHVLPWEISGDGSTMVGVYRISDEESQACLWRQGAFEAIPMPAGVTSSRATGVSFDGGLVFGNFFDDSGDRIGAFVWDDLNGTRLLKEFLELDYGLDLTGWQLLSVDATDASGNVITGYGINPQGQSELWIAIIPEPASILLLAAGAAWLRKRKG